MYLFRSPNFSMTCPSDILTWLWVFLSFSLLPYSLCNLLSLPYSLFPTLHCNLKSQLQARPYQYSLLTLWASLSCTNSFKLSAKIPSLYGSG